MNSKIPGPKPGEKHYPAKPGTAHPDAMPQQQSGNFGPHGRPAHSNGQRITSPLSAKAPGYVPQRNVQPHSSRRS